MATPLVPSDQRNWVLEDWATSEPASMETVFPSTSLFWRSRSLSTATFPEMAAESALTVPPATMFSSTEMEFANSDSVEVVMTRSTVSVPWMLRSPWMESLMVRSLMTTESKAAESVDWARPPPRRQDPFVLEVILVRCDATTTTYNYKKSVRLFGGVRLCRSRRAARAEGRESKREREKKEENE